jgi:hypothetical protein
MLVTVVRPNGTGMDCLSRATAADDHQTKDQNCLDQKAGKQIDVEFQFHRVKMHIILQKDLRHLFNKSYIAILFHFSFMDK